MRRVNLARYKWKDPSLDFWFVTIHAHFHSSWYIEARLCIWKLVSVENKSLAIFFARSFPCYSVRRALQFSSLSLSLANLRSFRVTDVVSILQDLDFKIIIIPEKEISRKRNPESSVKLDLGLSIIVTPFFIPFVLFSLVYASVASRFWILYILPSNSRYCCFGWFIVELAFCPAGKTPAAGFPRKITVLRFCLYSPSTSEDIQHPVRSRSTVSRLYRPTVKLEIIVTILVFHVINPDNKDGYDWNVSYRYLLSPIMIIRIIKTHMTYRWRITTHLLLYCSSFAIREGEGNMWE